MPGLAEGDAMGDEGTARRSSPLGKFGRAITWGAAVLFGLGIVAAIADNSGGLTSANTEAPAAPAPVATSATPAALAAPTVDLTSAKALEDKYETTATASCDTYVDDYLRGVAKFDFKWDDDTRGLFGTKFNKFRDKVDAPGVLTLVSDRLMLQNGFGAYERVGILCRYDTQNDKALGFELMDGGE